MVVVNSPMPAVILRFFLTISCFGYPVQSMSVHQLLLPLQLQTNKVNKSDISVTYQFLGNPISDSCSTWWIMSKTYVQKFSHKKKSCSDLPNFWPKSVIFYVPKLGLWQHLGASWHFEKLCDGPFAYALPMQPFCQTGDPGKHRAAIIWFWTKVWTWTFENWTEVWSKIQENVEPNFFFWGSAEQNCLKNCLLW